MSRVFLLGCLLVAACPGPPPEEPPPDLAAEDLLAEPDGTQAPDLLPPFPPADINHLLCTGQSLSIGSAGSPALSTTQPFDNLMFNTGVIAGGTNLMALQPLVERSVETMASGLANLTARMAREEIALGRGPHDLLISCHGVGGTAYAGLKKGTTPYANGLAQVRAGKMLSEAMGRTYLVRGVTNVHGESDHIVRNARYAQDLLAWQADYEADVRALTGQAAPVPMFHSQMSSWTRYNSTVSMIPGAQLQASLERPDRLILVGPKYFLPYADGIHLTNEGYRQLGEYYAKAYRRVVLEGQPFSPLRPLKARGNGAVITVTFQVPVPPLVLDTTLVKDPGRYGFEFTDDSATPPGIRSVQLAGPDAVRITLERAPGSGAKVRYAFTGRAGANAGPQSGPRGNLRDSDTTTSRHGYALFNWCVHFEIPVQ